MCKIKDLDRNEVYGLGEIKKDAVKFDMLKEWLKDNDIDWTDLALLNLSRENYIRYSSKENQWVFGEWAYKSTKCALTLFDLDITDYQVDCSELSSEKINNLCNIFEAKGYTLYHTKDALDVINEMKYFRKYYNSFGIFELSSHKEIIEYDKFIELFDNRKEVTATLLAGSCEDNHKANKVCAEKELGRYLEDLYEDICATTQGYKERDNKCNYELDFDFIHDLAMRIQNEPKYEPYNWQKTMNVEQLSNAMLRHAIEVKKGNFDDNGELGHLLAIAANAMFIYYQKKNNE